MVKEAPVLTDTRVSTWFKTEEDFYAVLRDAENVMDRMMRVFQSRGMEAPLEIGLYWALCDIAGRERDE